MSEEFTISDLSFQKHTDNFWQEINMPVHDISHICG